MNNLAAAPDQQPRRAVAGVKQPGVACAKGAPSLRVVEGRFMVIEQQAMGVGGGRARAQQPA